ncbi:MAG: hypothetical protein F4X34_01130 [Chloroflexi bacterium]|nr:hypothetical protein [Chloroflexota bacterium]
MEQQPTQTFRRNPFEIIGECFSIYGRHFRKLFLIALIIQVPLAAFGFALADRLPAAEDLQRLQASLIGDPRAALPGSAEYSLEGAQELPEPLTGDEIVGFATSMAILFIVTLILQTFASGVIVAAVAMQYATGRIDVGACYGRAWWRVISLVILGLLLFGLIVLMIAGFALFIVPGIVILALIIYWSVDVPAVVIEGCKPISALRRSFELVRGNWWRTFATITLMTLTLIGFTVVLTLLLSAPLALLGDDGLSETMTQVSSSLLGMLTNAIILPIAATVGALIYLDLRARNEDYDTGALSQELGLTSPT